MISKKRFICLLIVSFIFSVCFACTAKNQSLLNSSTASIPTTVDNLSLPPSKDFRIVVISDLNSQYGSTEYEPEVGNAIALMTQWQPDLVLCGGDMIA